MGELRVVGAGLGRTGTHSLKVALERLLGGRCYHMVEVFGRMDDAPTWERAFRGEAVDWPAFFAGDWTATVDWPGAGAWRPMADAFPDALVLLSTRADDATWWRSADATIFAGMRKQREAGSWGEDPWSRMIQAMLEAFGAPDLDEASARAAYRHHNDEVRASVPAGRLVEWQPADGWGPLCAALDVPVPDEPFPVTNTTDEFRARAGLA